MAVADGHGQDGHGRGVGGPGGLFVAGAGRPGAVGLLMHGQPVEAQLDRLMPLTASLVRGVAAFEPAHAEGEEIRSLHSPLIPPRAIAVDPVTSDIFVANDGDPIHRLDQEGNTLSLYSHRLRPYGLAWFPHDKDGYKL